MRTVILFGAILIGSAIEGCDKQPNDTVTTFLAIMLMITMAMDVAEFLNDLFKK